MSNRRVFLKNCFVAGAGCYSLGSASALVRDTPPRKPLNLIVLFVDDLGWGDIEYGNKQYDTPNINRLMADGATFTDAYAASPTCSPSRATVLTGKHAARLRLVRHIPGSTTEKEFNLLAKDPAQFPSRNWLPLSETTYAKALKPLGYHNIFIGKWHLGPEPYAPIHHGFDIQRGFTSQGHPKSYFAPFFKPSEESYREAPKGKYLTDQLTDDAVDYLVKRDPQKPFQMTLFYYSTHAPYQARKDLLAKSEARGLTGSQAKKAAMIAAVDESVGRIRAALNKQGIAKRTSIIFAGDQGSHFPKEPLRGGKKGGEALYEGGARIPFSVYWPGVTKPAQRYAEPVLTTDIFPTLLDMASGDASAHPDLDGASLRPLINGQGEWKREAVFMYRSYESQYAAVRSGDWKMIAYRDGRRELYNLKDDLGETNDLATSRQGKVKELNVLLRDWEKKMGVLQK